MKMVRRAVLNWFIAVGLLTWCFAQSGCADAGDAAADVEPAEVLTFKVEGMFCEGCVGSVRHAIERVDHVQTCEVSLEEERAVVGVSDPAAEEEIIAAVRDLDFTIERIAN